RFLSRLRNLTQMPHRCAVLAQARIKYLIYSHHHYDHIAGGKVFKDAAYDQARRGTTLDLVYTGRNHSDSSIVIVAAKGEDPLRRRFQFTWRRTVSPRGQRFLSDRMGSILEKDACTRVGTDDSRPSRAEWPFGHAQ